MFRRAYPDDTRRHDAPPRFFSLFTEILQRHDETYLSAHGGGAALWAPPGQTPVPEEQGDELGRRLEEPYGPEDGPLLCPTWRETAA